MTLKINKVNTSGYCGRTLTCLEIRISKCSTSSCSL